MILIAFPSGPIKTNAYLIYCQKTKQAAIVDPAPDSFDKISSYIAKHQLLPKLILLTHSHWDHIGDVAKFKTAYSLPVWAHALDLPNVETPGIDQVPCWIQITGAAVDHTVQDDEHFFLGEAQLVALWTPGHTPGGVCYYCPEAGLLLSGDTIFRGTIGRLDLATGQPEKMWGSLEKLARLPKETKVYPGHGPSTTIGREAWLTHPEDIFG